MKSDLTCPVEVVSVDIEREDTQTDTKEDGQLVCHIEFFNLSEKVIDSLQMNIICFNEAGERLGGRLVRAAALGGPREAFFGDFRPDHVAAAVRVEASVEKVWFQDGVIWRREERNVREYTPNALPQGRELDRLRAVAGEDAKGYAREDDIVWMCVCGRANRTSDEACMRCERKRAQVLRDYSFAAIDSTVGRRERQLEKQTQDTLRRSSEETERSMKAHQKKSRRRRRAMKAIIALLILVAAALAALRWGVPCGACMLADYELAQGKPADAKAVYEWVHRYWPGFMDADERAKDAECLIIQRLIEANTDASLNEALRRARQAEGEKAASLCEEAVIARAERFIQAGDSAQAEELLASMPQSEKVHARYMELVYDMATAAKERVDYRTAIERFASLGEYSDAVALHEECIYLYGRQLLREGKYAEAEEQFLQVTGRTDAIDLIRRCRYALAQQKQESGAYIDAAQIYETLGVYEEAQTRARFCRYTAGMSELGTGNLELAAQQLRLAYDYEDAQERFADAVFTLGSAALAEKDYPTAIGWLEQLDLTQKEVADTYKSAVYAYAQELEGDGLREAAKTQYGLLGDYLDALERVRAIEYALAQQEMGTSLESAMERFEGLGDYLDAEEQVLQCRYLLAVKAYEAGRYQEATTAFEALADYSDSESWALRSRYAWAEQLSVERDYETAATQYEACGVYLNAEELAMRARYDHAAALEESGDNRAAGLAFAALGSFEDAKQRTQTNEDIWLADAYSLAKMDMEVGDYPSVVEALEELWQDELPTRYADMADMYETACVERAKELIAQKKPLDALPFLERIPENEQAQKLLNAYVYQIIGRWKAPQGVEYIFRRDGSCAIAGVEGYFGGQDYRVFVGYAPYPANTVYSVVSLKNKTLTLRDEAQNRNIRLSYLGEATGPDADASTATDGEAIPNEE